MAELRKVGSLEVTVAGLGCNNFGMRMDEERAKVVAAGKVREIGCSNFSAQMLEDAAAAANELGVPGFVNVQNSYSLLDRTVEHEVIPACERLGMTLMPYFPLASGVLTGKYTRGEPAPEGTRLAGMGDRAAAMLSDERMDAVDRLATYAKEHGHTLHELALSYLAGSPTVASVIAGATSAEQLQA